MWARLPVVVLALLLLLAVPRHGWAALQFQQGATVPWEQRTMPQIDFLYRTIHRGEMCSSMPHGYVIEPAPVNVCYPADPMSTLPHKYSCTTPGEIKDYQYGLFRNEYAKSDQTCSLAPAEGKADELVKKDAKCKKSIDSGSYLLAHCGQLDSELLKDQLVVKTFTDPLCQGGRSLYGTGLVQASLLGQCAPVNQPPEAGAAKDLVAYHRILTAPAASNANSATTHVFVVLEDRYSAQDVHCRKAPVASTTVTYDATVALDGSAPCKADPLSPGGGYTFATVVTAAALATTVPPYWVLYP